MIDELFLGEVRKKYRVPLKKGDRIAEEVHHDLEPLAEAIMVAGSVRRRTREIADVEFVILPKDPEEFHREVTEIGFEAGEKRRKYTGVKAGVKVELYIAKKPEELGALLLAFTGDYLLNIAMRSEAKKMGYKMDQYGIWKDGKAVLQSPDEREFFDFLGMDWHWPEERSLARRSELSKLIRRLREAKPSDKDRRFIEEARKRLTEDKYIPADKETKLERLAEKYLGRSKVSLGAEELIELGEDGLGVKEEWFGPKEWRPGRQQNPFPGMVYSPREWREPDATVGASRIWYGPEGREGDIATLISVESGGWTVCEYSGVEGLVEDPPAPILKICTFVTAEFLSKVLAFYGVTYLHPDIFERDAEKMTRFAVDVGVAQVQYRGGDEEWEETLP